MADKRILSINYQYRSSVHVLSQKSLSNQWLKNLATFDRPSKYSEGVQLTNEKFGQPLAKQISRNDVSPSNPHHKEYS